MKISVTKDRVNIIKDDEIHTGEYNINKCKFEFSEEYTDDLVKIAIFVVDEKVIRMFIRKNECSIPDEVLRSNSNPKMGVYAYKVLNEQLELRYSPQPLYFYIDEGSYAFEERELDKATANEIEQALQEMNNTLNLADKKITTVSELIEELTSTSESLEEAQEIAKQLKEQLENGDFRGEPGKDGVGIANMTSNEDSSLTITLTNGKSVTTDPLKGVDGQNGEDGKDGKSTYQIWLDKGHDGTEEDFIEWLKGPQGPAGQDGKTPVNGKDYNTEAEKTAFMNECKTYIDENYLSILQGEC